MPGTVEALQAQLSRLQAENAGLKRAKVPGVRRLSAKVSQKGACSVYGLGRFPVTLYAEQWNRLIAYIAEEGGLKAFLEEHREEFATKDNPRTA